MSTHRWLAVGLGMALAGAAMAAGQVGGGAAATAADGLVRVGSTFFDQVAVRPGADFRGYTKVMLDPTQVAFDRSWLKDMNANRITLLTRTTSEDADRIAGYVRAGFDDALARALKGAGYEIVAAPGADVLALAPHVVELYVNAPASKTMSVPSRVYTQEAGEAKFALEVRDSATGALLARVDDHRTAGDRGNFRSSFKVTNPVTNGFDFGRMADFWAQSSARSLAEFKARSPVAAGLPPPAD